MQASNAQIRNRSAKKQESQSKQVQRGAQIREKPVLRQCEHCDFQEKNKAIFFRHVRNCKLVQDHKEKLKQINTVATRLRTIKPQDIYVENIERPLIHQQSNQSESLDKQQEREIIKKNSLKQEQRQQADQLEEQQNQQLHEENIENLSNEGSNRRSKINPQSSISSVIDQSRVRRFNHEKIIFKCPYCENIDRTSEEFVDHIYYKCQDNPRNEIKMIKLALRRAKRMKRIQLKPRILALGKKWGPYRNYDLASLEKEIIKLESARNGIEEPKKDQTFQREKRQQVLNVQPEQQAYGVNSSLQREQIKSAQNNIAQVPEINGEKTKIGAESILKHADKLIHHLKKIKKQIEFIKAQDKLIVTAQAMQQNQDFFHNLAKQKIYHKVVAQNLELLDIDNEDQLKKISLEIVNDFDFQVIIKNSIQQELAMRNQKLKENNNLEMDLEDIEQISQQPQSQEQSQIMEQDQQLSEQRVIIEEEDMNMLVKYGNNNQNHQ